MNQKKKIKLIATIFILTIILIMIICAYTNKTKKNKLIQNNINALNNGDTTIIDITGITPSPESQHEHIYKTHYDDTKHWEECIVCGTKRNEQIHSLTTTWTKGYESCEQDNYYKKTCICGYLETGHKPCVWDGTSYQYNNHYHIRKCSVCRGNIAHSYYLHSYGNGKEYDVEENRKYPYPDQKFAAFCYFSDGTLLDCSKSGVCSECKQQQYAGSHMLFVNRENGNIYCQICNKEFGTYSEKITTNQSNNYSGTEYTIVANFNLIDGAYFLKTQQIHNLGEPWETQSQEVSNLSQDHRQFTITTKAKFKDSWKEGYSAWIYTNLIINGVESVFARYDSIFYPDITKPTISSIHANGNEWTKLKPITISGTENYCNTVIIEIKNDKGKVVYSGGANVVNNNWSVSCTPEIEAGEEARTFTVTVTDACENRITQTFDVSKVDGRPPTLTSSDKVTDSEWAREKSFTFTAEDLGIGNVEIGFNDVSDYSLAVKDGTNYSKEYKLVGDAYSPVQASVYFKDGLGNITTQVVTLEKIDNTAPTITNASLNNNVVSLTSHDRHSMLGEGSGVVKYRYITSTKKLENPQITENNSQEVGKDEILTIPNISEVKYIYIVAEDLVGNVSDSYEIEVPQLVLTSKVNPDGVNGKGVVILDWTGYDITNKYFIIYRKQKDEEEWKTIVGIDKKLNNNTYTDPLGNDIAKPEVPQITMEKDIEAGKIKINQTATDNGTTYTYYIEAYDQNTNTLIATSNTN